MNYLTAKQIRSMQDNDVVYVNRIAINARLVHLNLLKEDAIDAKRVLYKAINQIKKREHRKRVCVWGAKMKICEVNMAFNIEDMPHNSFCKIR